MTFVKVCGVVKSVAKLTIECLSVQIGRYPYNCIKGQVHITLNAIAIIAKFYKLYT